MKNNPKLQQQFRQLDAKLHQLQQYSLIGFLVLLAAVYGFVLFRIQTISSEQPADGTINSQAQSVHVPHIDRQVVQQLQSLQDNSVSVQTLFDQARDNPFQQ